MKEAIDRILELQASWTAENTPEMEERGDLIRNVAPGWIRQHAAELARAVGIPSFDLLVEGRDGTGLKAQVPWFRIASRTQSESATEGWYLVYLFSAQGKRVYLSLNQGTTRWDGLEYRPRPAGQLRARVAWARAEIDTSPAPEASVDAITLDASSSLAKGYEVGHVTGVAYERGHIPGQDVLLDDLLDLSEILGAIYRAVDTAPAPGDDPPEVVDARRQAAMVAGKAVASTGGGFRLDASGRQAIEGRAKTVATTHYEERGWKVRRAADTKPYDLELVRPGEKLTVAVKGTTSSGDQLIVTQGEVLHHRRAHPSNALIVVHDIRLDTSSDPPTASGGILEETSPWELAPESLTPISYVHRQRRTDPGQ